MSDCIGLDRGRAFVAAADGIGRSDDHADEEWKTVADEIIYRFAMNQPTVTSEDVWATGLPENPAGSNAALGARFRAAQTKGWIERSDRTVSTLARNKHGSRTVVWVSKLYRGAGPAEPAEPAGRDGCVLCDELRDALAVLYWCARRGYDLSYPDAGIVPGSREADLRRVCNRVAELLGRPKPWRDVDDGSGWLAGWLADEINEAAPGLLSGGC